MTDEGKSNASSGRLSGPLLAAIYVALALLVLSPLLWARIPPLVDYPAHLARVSILAAPGASQSYVAHWRLIPNLAMDLVVPALSALIGLEPAGRLFVAVTMILPLVATALLHRALFGRVGLWPLASLLFLYNFALFFGFLGFLFSLGLALLGFAGWVASGQWRPVPRIALFGLFALVLFVGHLFAFGIYGLLVGSYEGGQLLAARSFSLRAIGRRAVLALQFVPAIAVWLTHLAAGKPHTLAYGDLSFKLNALIAPMNFRVVGLSLAPVVGLLFILAWRFRLLRGAPSMRWPILAVIAVAIIMPDLLYGSYWADIRLPITLAFLAVASTEPQLKRAWIGRVVALLILALVGARVAAVTLVWQNQDQRYSEFRTITQALPRGARLLVARTEMPENYGRIDGVPDWFAEVNFRVFYHISDLAIIDRDAFIPTLGLQLAPVDPAPRNAEINGYSHLPISWATLAEGITRPVSDPDDEDAGNYYWADWPHRYDYVLMFDFGAHDNPLPDRLQPVAQGSYFTYYKVIPGHQG